MRVYEMSMGQRRPTLPTSRTYMMTARRLTQDWMRLARKGSAKPAVAKRSKQHSQLKSCHIWEAGTTLHVE